MSLVAAIAEAVVAVIVSVLLGLGIIVCCVVRVFRGRSGGYGP